MANASDGQKGAVVLLLLWMQNFSWGVGGGFSVWGPPLTGLGIGPCKFRQERNLALKGTPGKAAAS